MVEVVVGVFTLGVFGLYEARTQSSRQPGKSPSGSGVAYR